MEHRRRPRPLGAFLAFGHPDVLAVGDPARGVRPAAPAADYGLGLRLVPWHGGTWSATPARCRASRRACSSTRPPATAVVALTNATTGLHTEAVPALLLGADDVEAVRRRGCPRRRCPTRSPSCSATGTGATPPSRCAGTTSGSRCTTWPCRTGEDASRLRDGRIVGVAGYHHGETLHVVRRDDGSVNHLECATFVYTREPYDPDVPIPGGHPPD